MNTLIDLIKSVKKSKRGVCFIKYDSSKEYITYNDLYEQSQEKLKFLRQCGVKYGEELVFQIEDEKEFIVTFWACIFGGIIAAPLPVCKNKQQMKMLNLIVTKLSSSKVYVAENLKDEFKSLLSVCDIDSNDINKKIIRYKNGEDYVEEIVDINRDTTAMIQFSSGSTGVPKGIELTHSNIMANVEAMKVSVKLTEHDKSLSWMPLTHNFGLIGFHITPLICSMDQVIMPTGLFLINPLVWLENISNKKITITASPNFGYMLCMKALKECPNPQFDLSSIRMILNGAEPVNKQVCEIFTSTLSVFNLGKNTIIPAYGMAEAGLAITISQLEKPYQDVCLDREFLTVGSEIVNSSDKEGGCTFVETGVTIDKINIRITNNEGKVLPEERIGNIEIDGPSIMKGYYHSEQENSKTFTEDGWLKTGDIGFLHDSHLYITGRQKEIMFINGKNYYPQDFEALIQKVPHSEKMAVAVMSKFSEAVKTEVILAFIEIDLNAVEFKSFANDIRKFVNKNTGIEISEVIQVPRMPRTGSGKIRKFELLKKYTKEDNNEFKEVFRPKEISLEENKNINQVLNTIFCNVLEMDYISEKDEFSDLGMNSLKAGLIVSQINHVLEVNLKLSTFFKCNSIKALEKEVDKMKSDSYEEIQKASVQKYYPLSSQQKRLYAIHQIDSESINYNIFNGVRIQGKLDKNLVSKAFETIINRHEALRTSFELVDNEPVQIIHDRVESPVKFIKMSIEELEEHKKTFVKPFNLNLAPLMRIEIIELSEEEHILLMDVHHIVSDGMSMGYIIKEFSALYNGHELAEVKRQYKDYAVWQQNKLKVDGFNTQKNYWKDNFQGKLPVLDLPVDYERKSVQSFNGDRVKLSFDKEFSDKLYNFTSSHGITLYMLLMASCGVLLSKYTTQEEMLIGSPISGRSHTEFDGTVGMFVNTVVIRNRPQSNKKVIDYIDEIKDSVYNAYENQDYQFEWILNDLNIKKVKGRNPMFDIMFNMQNMNIPKLNLKGLQCETYSLEDKATRFDLIFIIHENESLVDVEFVYCTDLFKKNTIKEMKDHFSNILNQIVEGENKQIKDISILNTQNKVKVNSAKKKDLLKANFNF